MLRLLTMIGFLCFAAMALFAQSGLSLQGARHDNSLPIEVTADTLTVEQEAQTAVFSGSARAVQGSVALEAETLRVTYSEETGEIVSFTGEGSVTYSNGEETARAERASYTNSSNLLMLEGAVRLVQGQTVITANQMVLNVSTNAAELTGNVRTRFVPRN